MAMTWQEIKAYCEALGEVEVCTPFGPNLYVMTWMPKRKMFALFEPGDDPLHLIMKCEPMEAEILRAAYASVSPGYHMNKKHWNSVMLDGSVPDEEIQRMLRNAYRLVSGRKRELEVLRV